MVAGRLDVLGLESLMQIAEWERWTGRLMLPMGKVVFLVGEPISAKHGEHEGIQALFEHFLDTAGEFELEEISVRGDPPLGRPVELVMEGLRRRDEWNDLAGRVLKGSLGELKLDGKAPLWQVLQEQKRLRSPVVDAVRELLQQGKLRETGPQVPPEPAAPLKPVKVTVEDTRPSIWIMTEDPAVDQAEVTSALSRLEKEGVKLVFAHPETREAQSAALKDGRMQPPWVLVFGDMHVLLGDPMLLELGCCGEISRLQVSTHLNAELLQTTANFCGLDHSLTLPSSEDDIVAAIRRMVERTERLRSH